MPSFANPLERTRSEFEGTVSLENTVDIIDFDTVSYERKDNGSKKSLSLNVYNYEKILMPNQANLDAVDDTACHAVQRLISAEESLNSRSLGILEIGHNKGEWCQLVKRCIKLSLILCLVSVSCLFLYFQILNAAEAIILQISNNGQTQKELNRQFEKKITSDMDLLATILNFGINNNSAKQNDISAELDDIKSNLAQSIKRLQIITSNNTNKILDRQMRNNKRLQNVITLNTNHLKTLLNNTTSQWRNKMQNMKRKNENIQRQFNLTLNKVELNIQGQQFDSDIRQKNVNSSIDKLERRLDDLPESSYFLDLERKVEGLEKGICVAYNCENSGECKIEGDEPSCDCLPGFSGVKCHRSVCDDYCENNGQCRVKNTGDPNCSCNMGYFGDQCQNCHCRLDNSGVLHSGEQLDSSNFEYAVKMQTDGNLVLYEGSRVLWASGTYGKGRGPYELRMQSDNHLVLYDADSSVVWAPGVHIGKDDKQWAKGGYAIIQDNGNFAVYDGNNQIMWHSGTNDGRKGSTGGKIKKPN